MNRRAAGVAFIALSLIVRESPGLSFLLALVGVGCLIREEFPDRLYWRRQTTILLVVTLIALAVFAVMLFFRSVQPGPVLAS
jgi:hypothetical protein